jgi:hypothetical protein
VAEGLQISSYQQMASMARAIWAMLTKGEDYSDPALIAAA